MLTVLLLLLSQTDAGPATAVVVTVDQIRSSKGAVVCQLYSGAAGFPEKQALRTVTAPIREKGPKSGELTATCSFGAVPPGRYAVAVLHDEDGDGVMKKGLFGIPQEGYGTSNNHTHPFSSPTFDEASFPITPKDEFVSVDIHAVY